MSITKSIRTRIKELRRASRMARDAATLRRLKNTDAGPILIYQMGKVGSSTIRASLRKAGFPSFQFHSLDESVLQQEADYHARRGSVPPKHIERSLLVRKELLDSGTPLRVITLVREPISRNISAYFENLERYTQIENAAETASVDFLLDHFLKTKPELRALNWFESELERFLGIDVYSHPFEAEQRFTRFRSGNHEVLILRIDAEDAVKARALADFVGIPEVGIVNSNVSDDSSYAAKYKQFKQRVQLSKHYFDAHINSRLLQHFFTPIEREQVAQRWAPRIAAA